MKNKLKYLIIIAAACYMLPSCNIYTKYKRPEISLVDSTIYRFIESTNDTSSLAQLSWRKLFSDPMLVDLIDQGLKNNSNLNIAKLRVDDAEAVLRTARSAYLPALSLGPQGSVSTYNGSGAVGTYSIAASANWELDVFGRITNAKEKAKAALEQSKAYRQTVQTQLISTISNSYYTLLMLDKQLDISLRTVANWEENIRVMKALKRAGNVNESAILQAESNKMSLESNVLVLKRQIQEVENSLSSLLASPPTNIKRGSLDNQIFPSEVSIGVPLQLLSNRPDVRQAEYLLAQKFYATNEARSSFYPSITLGGTFGWANNGGGSLVNPGAWLSNAVVSLLQPIYNRGVLKANLQISKSEQEQALISFKQTILDAGTEVNNALLQWQTARIRLDIDDRQISTLQKVVYNTELVMKYSSSTYLEVLTAQYSLLQAELLKTSNRFDEIQGVINLYRSLGGGEY